MKRVLRFDKLLKTFLFFQHFWLIYTLPIASQVLNGPRPEIQCGIVKSPMHLDGILDETEWKNCDSLAVFRMVIPRVNENPSFETTIKIICDSKNIYLGFTCYDSSPDLITAFSKARDASLLNEDYIKFVFDTYQDGRNAYIFAVNPYGARYDALISNRGASEDSNWDGIWEAKTRVGENGWTAEIRIPVNTMTFRKGLDSWGFNAERRIQRFMEVDRWTAISQDYKLTQTLHSGQISHLPVFNLGIGLIAKASTIGDFNRSITSPSKFKWDGSLDLTQRIVPGISAQLTVNTDFAETEVDTRRTNLTRFSLLFPEKRQFFLEGSDIYDFGLGLSEDFLPFQSRKIGLVNGKAVPLTIGGKMNGKVGKTQFGALVTRTGAAEGLVAPANMGVIRVKQNILKESTIGLMGMYGDPLNRSHSWAAGADFTYQNSQFLTDQNLLIGAWGMLTRRDSLEGDRSGYGLTINYPNDLLDISMTYYRLGDAFDPSLGLIPRIGISNYRLSCDFSPRPGKWYIRQWFFESSFSLITDLFNHWESYRVFLAPINTRFESGDRVEFNIVPAGEFLKEPFEISDGVVISAKAYNWTRFRLEAGTATKRPINGQATWWFGGFYGGRLDQLELLVNCRFLGMFAIEGNFERNVGALPYGDFIQNLYGIRLQLNINSDLNVSSFVQFDSESQSFGTNNRIRWTFAPRGDLFIVYNHNMHKPIEERWPTYESNQLIIKLAYGIGL
ncbi:MAG: hypothetical protein D4R64_03770 [Porphyromonadaceae bacterium]|nr:MAG: hypothetical protein D4R64_03770 [Porphyromonadaceae bacterium]